MMSYLGDEVSSQSTAQTMVFQKHANKAQNFNSVG